MAKSKHYQTLKIFKSKAKGTKGRILGGLQTLVIICTKLTIKRDQIGHYKKQRKNLCIIIEKILSTVYFQYKSLNKAVL